MEKKPKYIVWGEEKEFDIRKDNLKKVLSEIREYLIKESKNFINSK